MLALFVTSPWPSFYRKGIKSWEIRSYPIEYRGDIIIVESKTNKVICKMQLTDCIPLNKERWEMNFEKHRTSCSYEDLPFKKDGPAYAWILSNPSLFDNEIIIHRPNTKPYIYIEDSIISESCEHPITFHPERIACKFIGDTMLLYWMKKNYFALIAVVNLSNGHTQLITAEISQDEIDYILSQIQA